MSEFLYLYRNAVDAPAASPEQMQQTMGKWMAWMKELSSKGNLKKPGNPLEPKGKVVKGIQRTVTDGPYAEAKDIIGGYTIVEANDLAQAVALAEGCPVFESGGSVEVRPVMQINM